MNQSAPIDPQTDKMLSRKEGSVGYVIFNNPERHNAVSLECGRRRARSSTTSATTTTSRVVVVTGAGGKAFVSGADISQIRERALRPRRRSTHYNAAVEHELRRVPRIPEADHRHDPRLLHRRRHGARDLLRHAHRTEGSKFARAGGEARPRLRLFRPQAAGRRGRAVLRQGDLLHGAAIRPQPRRWTMGLVNRVVPDGRAREATSRITPRPSPATRR